MNGHNNNVVKPGKGDSIMKPDRRNIINVQKSEYEQWIKKTDGDQGREL